MRGRGGRHSGDGEFAEVGSDDNAPHRIFYDFESHLESGVGAKAAASDFGGSIRSSAPAAVDEEQ